MLSFLEMECRRVNSVIFTRLPQLSWLSRGPVVAGVIDRTSMLAAEVGSTGKA